MKIKATILEKATNNDDSAVIYVETENGDRMNFHLPRSEARSSFNAGSSITIEVSSDEVEALPAENINQPSSETEMLLNRDSEPNVVKNDEPQTGQDVPSKTSKSK